MKDKENLEKTEVSSEENIETSLEEIIDEKTPIEKMEELEEIVEEEFEGQKELMFFKHMFGVYNSSKFQVIISFVIAMGLYSFRIFFNEASAFLPFQMIIAFFGAMGINAAISLFRCSFNTEIKLELRKLSKKLGIYLFFAIVCIFIMVAFF